MDAHLIGIHDFALFVAAGLLLNITPGPDTLYIVGRSTTQGNRAGAMAALGVSAGCCIHTVAAAAGISALLLASATTFAAVKLVGALYLVYLGVALLRSGGSTEVPAAPRAPAPLPRIFMEGLLTNARNPKVALFFVAFLPQFVAGDAPHKFIALAILGVVFNANATLWNLFVAWLAARARGGLPQRARIAAGVGRITGGLMIAFGIRLAVAVRD